MTWLPLICKSFLVIFFPLENIPILDNFKKFQEFGIFFKNLELTYFKSWFIFKPLVTELLIKINSSSFKKRIFFSYFFFKELICSIFLSKYCEINFCSLSSGKKITTFDLFPGIKTMLHELFRDHELHILTANSKSNVEKFLKKHELKKYFTKITSRANPFDKSHAIKTHLKKNKLKQSQTVYIGDELSDLKACNKINQKIISVTWGFNKIKLIETEKPKYVANSPREIVTLINDM